MDCLRMGFAFIVLFLSFLCAGVRAESSESSLQQFARDPKTFLARIPIKYRDSLLTQNVHESPFSDREIEDRAFMEKKSREWTACQRQQTQLLSAFRVSPRLNSIISEPISQFFDGRPIIDQLSVMDAKKLKIYELPQHPWSGDYWPIAKGTLSSRYKDTDFVQLWDWISRFQFIQKKTAEQVLGERGQEGVDLLSVAEKYDLLIGGEGFLTSANWQEGKAYYDSTGDVESWMGICHGWAVASFMDKRPDKSVIFNSFDQKWSLPFNPSETKGILSYLWAKNPYPHKSMGQRCEKKSPQKDENGRLTDPECLDVNPAAWHLTMVNRLGVGHEALIMDASYDYEVWNQPVFSYSYTYFNPQTKAPESNLKRAAVRPADFSEDIFAKYRSPMTKTIVGITMRVGYVVETMANNSETDNPENDQIRWVEYLYDLELDAAGRIIGGEWYSNAHPDFLWAPANQAQPKTWIDYYLREAKWEPSNATLPDTIALPAREAAQEGLILHFIGSALGERASTR